MLVPTLLRGNADLGAPAPGAGVWERVIKQRRERKSQSASISRFFVQPPAYSLQPALQIHHIDKTRCGAFVDFQALEVEQVAVGQLRGHHVLQGAEHDFGAAR